MPQQPLQEYAPLFFRTGLYLLLGGVLAWVYTGPTGFALIVFVVTAWYALHLVIVSAIAKRLGRPAPIAASPLGIWHLALAMFLGGALVVFFSCNRNTTLFYGGLILLTVGSALVHLVSWHTAFKAN
ncbi:MAG: hypothetical protein ACRD2L_01550 [Terriglobia bacterium]